MPDAIYRHRGDSIDFTPAADVAVGQLLQLPDGRAAFAPAAIAAGAKGAVRVEGVVKITKPAGIVFLDGQEVFWDYSADTAALLDGGDRDFYAGMVVNGDAASAATSMEIALNQRPNYKIDLRSNGFRRIDVANATNFATGGGSRLALSATNEAQKTDLLSRDGFAMSANWILDAQVTISNGGAGAAPDFNLGVATATHATDFDSVAQYCALHIDGNSVDLKLQSKDGTTTVASTDTTIDYTANTTLTLTMDGRTPGDVQCYLNGALVLGATVFDVGNGTGTWKAIVHLEKTAATDVFEVYIDRLTVRIQE
jgi:predicted RecA/RadA family phage recombinase